MHKLAKKRRTHEHVIADLGGEEPTHVLFEHPASDTKVVLRHYHARDVVSPMDLAVVRKTLDERGLMANDSFEHFMRRKPA
jgi:hypothetical protein